MQAVDRQGAERALNQVPAKLWGALATSVKRGLGFGGLDDGESTGQDELLGGHYRAVVGFERLGQVPRRHVALLEQHDVGRERLDLREDLLAAEVARIDVERKEANLGAPSRAKRGSEITRPISGNRRISAETRWIQARRRIRQTKVKTSSTGKGAANPMRGR